eukprot:SAG11_NODE_1945_length_4019_cov_6.325510_2_plen_170_part_00
MTKTQAILGQQGATATNYFIHTPICCPSRAELLSGRYFHNIKARKPTDPGCMHVNVSLNTSRSPFYAGPEAGGWYFAPHLQQAGYTVGVFGKHLNNGYTSNNPACPPVGVDRWFANGGGDYYRPSFAWASAGDPKPAHASFSNCSYNAGGGRTGAATRQASSATPHWPG